MQFQWILLHPFKQVLAEDRYVGTLLRTAHCFSCLEVSYQGSQVSFRLSIFGDGQVVLDFPPRNHQNPSRPFWLSMSSGTMNFNFYYGRFRRNNSLQNVPYMYSYDPWYEDACNLPKLCEGMAHVGAVIASSIITQYRVFWNGWSEIARHVINHWMSWLPLLPCYALWNVWLKKKRVSNWDCLLSLQLITGIHLTCYYCQAVIGGILGIYCSKPKSCGYQPYWYLHTAS